MHCFMEATIVITLKVLAAIVAALHQRASTDRQSCDPQRMVREVVTTAGSARF